MAVTFPSHPRVAPDRPANGRSKSDARSYYAVRVGRIPGIYRTWAEADAQVKGHPGNRHKRFNTREEANAFMHATINQ